MLATKQTGHFRFNIGLLGDRVKLACWLINLKARWMPWRDGLKPPVNIGLLGASTGAAAALITAA